MVQGIIVYQNQMNKLLTNVNQVMIGKEDIAKLSLVALLAQGHVLLEDVPGVGKTMLVRSLAKSLDCEFKRIQFTPDLLPSDITGVSIYHPKKLEFEFRAGPIFGNIILADEINRTSPKTQSALLEGMEESSVTVDGVTVPLKEPFFVMATQNPIEYEGTYPLPEAQLDRFMLKLKMGYPSVEEELEILMRTSFDHPINHIEPVMTKEDLIGIQAHVKNIFIAKKIQQYIVHLVTLTRNNEHIYVGVSPRGSIALMKAAKAFAYIEGRDFVLPDDVKYLAPFVLAHRLILTPEAIYNGKTSEGLIRQIVESVPVPIREDHHL